MKVWMLIGWFFLVIVMPIKAEEAATPPDPAAITRTLSNGCVQVEYMFQYDSGKEPKCWGCQVRCPNCGRYHGDSGEKYVAEERPFEASGFVLTPTQILTGDIITHSRFIKAIRVRFGMQRVSARPVFYAAHQNAIILELEKPLSDVEALIADGSKKPPYFAVTYAPMNGTWRFCVQPVPGPTTIGRSTPPALQVPPSCVIVDKGGTPVGFSINDELSFDDTWKGSPLKWEGFSTNEMEKIVKDIETKANNGLLRVKLCFRSPKKKQLEKEMYRYGMRDDESKIQENETEGQVIGILTDSKQVLVLAALKPEMTVRLDQIWVYPPKGDPLSASFKYSLRELDAFVAELKQPMDGIIGWGIEETSLCQNKLVVSAEVKMSGEKRVAYFMPMHVTALETGWKQYICPEKPMENSFLFNLKGQLLFAPVMPRPPITMEDHSWSRMEPRLLPAVCVKERLDHPEQYSDPGNVPLDEKNENRLAWLGMELQPLNKELANAHQVAHLTKQGRDGALISYIYPDSPAARAGVGTGWILLRFYVEGQSRPIDIQLREEQSFHQGYSFHGMPADEDNVPEEYLARMPLPWPSADSTLNRKLMEIGIGARLTAEFFNKDEILRKDFVIQEGPPSYENAPRCKCDSVGITVRDLTYEVRNHYLRKAADPGVIVSKVERGSKAAVSGVKHYDIITHVNDTPVMNVGEFEKAVKDQKTLRFAVSRKNRNVLVDLKMEGVPAREGEEKIPPQGRQP